MHRGQRPDLYDIEWTGTNLFFTKGNPCLRTTTAPNPSGGRRTRIERTRRQPRWPRSGRWKRQKNRKKDQGARRSDRSRRLARQRRVRAGAPDTSGLKSGADSYLEVGAGKRLFWRGEMEQFLNSLCQLILFRLLWKFLEFPSQGASDSTNNARGYVS